MPELRRSSDHEFRIPKKEHPVPELDNLTDDAVLEDDIENLTEHALLEDDIEDLTNDAVREVDADIPVDEDIPFESILESEQDIKDRQIGEVRKNIDDFFLPPAPEERELTPFEQENAELFQNFGKNNTDTKKPPALDITKSHIEDLPQPQVSFKDLEYSYGVQINPDGSIPRGGLLGGNKRKFDQLLKTSVAFQKRYDSLLARSHMARAAKGDLRRQGPDRGAAAIALAASLASVGGGMPLRHAENQEAERKTQIERTTQREAFDKLVGDTPSNASAENRFNIPVRNDIDVMNFSETKISLPSVDLQPGAHLGKNYFLELQSLEPGTHEIIPLGQVTTLELSKDLNGHMYASVHGESKTGLPLRAAEIDSNGIAHEASKMKVHGVEMNEKITKAPVKESSTTLNVSPDQTPKAAKKSRAEINGIGQIHSGDTVIQQISDEAAHAQIEDDEPTNHVSRFSEMDRQKGNFSDLAQSKGGKEVQRILDGLGTFTLKADGKGTVYDRLIGEFARMNGIDRRTTAGKAEAQQLVDDWVALQSQKGPVKFKLDGRDMQSSNIKDFLQNRGEITITIK